MSETIWKFTFPIIERFELFIPEQSSILNVEMQGLTPTMWALVNTDRPQRNHKFMIVGTGRPLPPDEAWKWLATFQQPPLVWHLFEIA